MTSAQIEQELLRLEKQYWQALKDRDEVTAMLLTDEPCILTGAQGSFLIHKKDLPAMIKAASYRLNDFTIDDDVQIRQLGNDVAVVAYKVHEQLTVDGKPLTLDAANASTWIKRNGNWLCALHTESILGDPFGRDRRSAQ